VSPDERLVTALIERARRRAKALLIAEAAAWAAAMAAAAFVLTSVLGFARPARLASIATAELAVAAAVGLMRRRELAPRSIVRALERAEPASQNVLTTAAELTTGELSAAPRVRARVFADAAAISRTVDTGRALPPTRLRRAVAIASAAWAVVIAVWIWRGASSVAPGSIFGSLATFTPAASPANTAHVTVTIQPPAYTSLPIRTLTDPSEIEAIEGSSANAVMGPFATRTLLQKTGYIAIGDGEARRTIPVVVTPDALPAATIVAPGRDLVLAGGNPRITFEARAADDFGLRALTLQFTKVSGSGEQFEFDEGEIPLAIAREDGRAWRGSASRSIAELSLKEGDTLVYRAVATDSRPGGGTASSAAFFIEISKLGVAAGDAFTLPEEETRYALSQQMLIIKTERLNHERAANAATDVRDTALNLAVEQRMIRAELVFMLGGEIEDEEIEAAQSPELQEGRLQNRGQRDLRAATIAMSQAEKLLTGVDLPAALTAERAAVAALQRAFARGRYILRALGSRTSLDFGRRLTGDVSKAADWRRTPPATPANRRVALMQDLLRGLTELGAANGFETRARVLSEEALRIDASSVLLRQTAAELQRAARTTDAAERTRALDAASTAAAAEARRSIASAPLTMNVAGGSLAGALSDVARGRSR
jgi:hypothetical protein